MVGLSLEAIDITAALARCAMSRTEAPAFAGALVSTLVSGGFVAGAATFSAT